MAQTVTYIITCGSLAGALGVILGVLSKAHKWYLEQRRQTEEIEKMKKEHQKDIERMKEEHRKALEEMSKEHKEDIDRIKEEDTLICYALAACLDGLEQLGANHTVPKAKDKLEKYLNQQAHR